MESSGRKLGAALLLLLLAGGHAAASEYDAAFEASLRLEREGRLEEAAMRFAPLFSEFPQDYAVALRWGWLNLRLERLGEAERGYGRAASLSDPSTDALSGLAEVLTRGERWPEVVARLAEPAWQREDAVLLRYLGNAQQRSGHPEKAELAYRMVLSRHPGDLLALRGIAAALAAQERWSVLVAVVGRAAAHEGDALLLRYLAYGRGRLGQRAEAAALYERALALEPGEPNALEGLAAIYLAEERWADAAALLAESPTRHAGRPLLACQLGLATLRLGRAAEAEGHYRRALDLAPGDEAALEGLAAALAAQGRHAEVSALLSPRMEAHGESPALRRLLGHALHEQGKFSGAAAQYRAALAIEAGDATSLLGLGWAQARLGEGQKARTSFLGAREAGAPEAEVEAGLAAAAAASPHHTLSLYGAGVTYAEHPYKESVFGAGVGVVLSLPSDLSLSLDYRFSRITNGTDAIGVYPKPGDPPRLYRDGLPDYAQHELFLGLAYDAPEGYGAFGRYGFLRDESEWSKTTHFLAAGVHATWGVRWEFAAALTIYEDEDSLCLEPGVEIPLFEGCALRFALPATFFDGESHVAARGSLALFGEAWRVELFARGADEERPVDIGAPLVWNTPDRVRGSAGLYACVTVSEDFGLFCRYSVYALRSHLPPQPAWETRIESVQHAIVLGVTIPF